MGGDISSCHSACSSVLWIIAYVLGEEFKAHLCAVMGTAVPCPELGR